MCKCGYQRYSDKKYFGSFSNSGFYSKGRDDTKKELDNYLNEESPYEYFNKKEHNHYVMLLVIFLSVVLFVLYVKKN